MGIDGKLKPPEDVRFGKLKLDITEFVRVKLPPIYANLGKAKLVKIGLF